MDVKCKIQYFLTERNQRVALNNTGCIPKSRIQKKKLSYFKPMMDQINPKNIKACLFINNLKQGTCRAIFFIVFQYLVAMNIILYNHAKNIKSESNFEMQSLQIKENQNNEIPFAEFAGWF